MIVEQKSMAELQSLVSTSEAYHTVFIDTSLDTHLAIIVSDLDTVSDLKSNCFPYLPPFFSSFIYSKLELILCLLSFSKLKFQSSICYCFNRTGYPMFKSLSFHSSFTFLKHPYIYIIFFSLQYL